MSKSDAWENGVLLLVFNGVAFTGIAQNHATPSDLYMALHTASPGDSGSMSTSEANYPGYARKQLARTTGNFTVSGASVSLAANQDFPVSTGSGTTLTHWSIGNSAGTILYHGALASPFAISGANVQPRVNAGTMVTEA